MLRQSGQSKAEFAVILVVVLIVAVAAIILLGGQLNNMLSTMPAQI